MSWNWIARLDELRRGGIPAVVVTVTGGTGSAPRDAGAKMIVRADGAFEGTIGGGHLEMLAIEEARRRVEIGESGSIRYPLGAKTGQCCGGVVDLFYEVVNAGPHLYVFGAGHVGQAVARTLEGTPFTVHLVDERTEWVNAPQLPVGVVRHESEWDEFARAARWDARQTYVVIMTFRHDLDEKILEGILSSRRDLRYLGLIGSAAKWERFRQRLLQKGIHEAALSRVRSPIGLPVGGKAPAEIAISLGAELLGIHYEKG